MPTRLAADPAQRRRDAESDITALVPHIAAVRLSARHVRRLARDIADPAAVALLGGNS